MPISILFQRLWFHKTLLALVLFNVSCFISNHSDAQVRIGDLEPNEIAQGETKEFILYGDNFAADMSLNFFEGTDPQAMGDISIEGGLTIEYAEDFGDGSGDRVTFRVTASGSAMIGSRNLFVNVPMEGGTTKYVALTVVEGSNSNNDQMDTNDTDDNTNNNQGSSGLYDDLPPRQQGQINAVTAASPPAGEPGDQVNLWIEGREFDANPTVKFSSTEILQAYNNNQPIPLEVVRNTSSTNREMDGILYYMVITNQVLVGEKIDITVQNSNGSSYTLVDAFEIAARGTLDLEQIQDSENIEAVTGASPLAIRSGRNSAMWIWGRGFNRESTLSLSNNAIGSVRPAQPVIGAQNYPGYDGMQAFLDVPAESNPGLVDVTITNPNGTSETGIELFQVVNDSGANGNASNDQPITGIEEACNGNDLETSISDISAVSPNEVERGKTTSVEIIGSGFACGSSIVYHGGGITPLSPPIFSKDTNNPNLNYFRAEIAVAEDAALGIRAITIVNPNGSVKTNAEAFEVIVSNANAQSQGGAACDTLNQSLTGKTNFTFFILLFILYGIRRYINTKQIFSF